LWTVRRHDGADRGLLRLLARHPHDAPGGHPGPPRSPGWPARRVPADPLGHLQPRPAPVGRAGRGHLRRRAPRGRDGRAAAAGRALRADRGHPPAHPVVARCRPRNRPTPARARGRREAGGRAGRGERAAEGRARLAEQALTPRRLGTPLRRTTTTLSPSTRLRRTTRTRRASGAAPMAMLSTLTRPTP